MSGVPLVLGSGDFGTAVPREIAWQILDTYASLGGRIVDTANNYAYWHPGAKGGESESVIGDWLEQRDRSAFTVMTKIGSQPVAAEDGSPRMEGLSPAAVHRAVDKSLARLKTDCIDILLAHHDDRRTPLLDTWQAFSDLVAAGKVRKVGISNYSPERVAELAGLVAEHSLAPIDCVQLKYSLIDPIEGSDFGVLVVLDRRMKRTLASLAPGAVVFAYSPLLGGKVFEDTPGGEWPPEYDSVRNRDKVREIRRRAGELGVSVSACVLKLIADEGFLPVTATSKAERLETNMKLLAAGFLKP